MSDGQIAVAPAKVAAVRVRNHEWLRAGLVVASLAAVLGALYAPVFPVWLEDVWDDPNYTHSFYVPLISAFIIWRRRRELAALSPDGSWWGIPVIFAGVIALILGDVGAETFLMRTSFIVVLTGLVLFHLGLRAFRILAFPLAFLFFTVPIPHVIFYAMTARLQTLAAEIGSSMLDLFGVPIVLDGNVIHLSRITLGVTEACSGIRSLLSLLFAAVAWAYLMLPTLWTRVALVAFVLPITIAVNAGRVLVTGLIGQWFGVRYAEGFFHFYSSWLLFVFALVCFLGVHRALRAVERRAQGRTT
jgi:exosortase